MPFVKESRVPNSICELLNIEEGTVMSRVNIIKLIYDYIKENKLRYENDPRVLRTDAKMSALLEIDMSVNESTDYRDPSGFNFLTIQRYINQQYVKAENVNESNHSHDHQHTEAQETLGTSA